MTHPHPEHIAPITPEDWDARYGTEHIWSGDPNGVLVAQVSDLAPGTALDVGCGEGADAVWLARKGWAVTALDVSGVAVARGRTAAEAAGVEVTWLVQGLMDTPLTGFDLVSAQYPAVPKLADRAVERQLADAVKPGGVLLFVHHVLGEDTPHGFDPNEYVDPDDVARYVRDAGWDVVTDETRERHLTQGVGAHHSQDRVVLARKPRSDES